MKQDTFLRFLIMLFLIEWKAFWCDDSWLSRGVSKIMGNERIIPLVYILERKKKLKREGAGATWKFTRRRWVWQRGGGGGGTTTCEQKKFGWVIINIIVVVVKFGIQLKKKKNGHADTPLCSGEINVIVMVIVINYNPTPILKPLISSYPFLLISKYNLIIHAFRCM